MNLALYEKYKKEVEEMEGTTKNALVLGERKAFSREMLKTITRFAEVMGLYFP
jgi:hypothetical protein